MKTSRSIDRNPRGFIIGAVLGVGLIAIPLVGLLSRVDWTRFLSLLGEQPVRSAVWISLVTSLTATGIAVVVGTPLAWSLARG